MKKAIPCLLFLLFSLPLLHAQKKIFLRIYDMNGQKIARGYLSATRDSSIILVNGNTNEEISVSRIGNIKTHHLSNRILKHSLEVAVIVVLVAVLVGYLILVITDRSHTYSNSYHNNYNGGKKTSKRILPADKYKVNGDLGAWYMQRLLLDQFL
jgi:ABC-type spermidine/putrescine transport system permease subunit I